MNETLLYLFLEMSSGSFFLMKGTKSGSSVIFTHRKSLRINFLFTELLY